jgi:polyhydroxybutyrate depolymerase
MKPGLLSSSLILLALLLGASACQAQDGSLRERLRQRQQERAASAPVSSPEAAAITAPGDSRHTLEQEGRTRLYRVHVPASYRPDTPAPLLVALHGGGGNMDHMGREENYGLISWAERTGVVLVLPNGISRLRNGMFATWNAGACCGAARDQAVDDVGFIRTLLERVRGQLNIDARRIYAAGMSNGAMMAYRLACELPGVFRAIAAVAGTDNTRTCLPAQAVAVLHIHARNDSHVLYAGGVGPDAVERELITDFRSVPATVEAWVERNACARIPQRVLERAGAWCERYAPCRDGSQVQLCVTPDGGHSWPGGSKRRASESPFSALSANEVMWDFFTQLEPVRARP